MIDEPQIGALAPTEGMVFVVDDVEGNRVLAEAYLEALGWQVRTFPDADALLQALQDSLPQAMLIDIRMPGMGGEQLARLLKANARTRDVRLVGYTAHALPDELVRVREAGFESVLVKPVLLQDMRRLFTRPQ